MNYTFPMEENVATESASTTEASPSSETTAAAADKIKKADEEAAEKVKMANAEAAEKVKKANAEAAEKMKKADAEAAEKMEKANAEAAEKIKTADAEAAEKMEKANAEAAEKLKTADAEAAEKMEKANAEAAEKIKTADAEAAEKMEKANAEAAEKIRKADMIAAEKIRKADSIAAEKIRTADAIAAEKLRVADSVAAARTAYVETRVSAANDTITPQATLPEEKPAQEPKPETVAQQPKAEPKVEQQPKAEPKVEQQPRTEEKSSAPEKNNATATETAVDKADARRRMDSVMAAYNYRHNVENRIVPPYENTVCPNVKATKWRYVYVQGTGMQTRAYSGWKGVDRRCAEYSKIANEYKEAFGEGVNVWLMPIPTAAAFYSPKNNPGTESDQYSTINFMFDALDKNVHCVDVHTILGQHADEEIFARTDHHWLPRGAFYAAKRLAALCKVPFYDIWDSTRYEEKVIHRFCGTMYSYSRNLNVKNNPEDFVFWKPTKAVYTTTYIKYKFIGPHKVTGESAPYEERFFLDYADGSGAAYCTFMGGDARLTHIHTNVANGRRILLVKDSFGNALPSFLMYSFEDIHVVDCRYFNKNLTEYVRDNSITDVVLCNNTGFMGAANIQDALRRYLTQNPTTK